MNSFLFPRQDSGPGRGRWVSLRSTHPTHPALILVGLLSLFLLGAVTPSLAGPIVSTQPARPTPPPEVVPISLVVHSAPEPQPALKYLLLPDIRDQSPGNAALLYYRAFSPEWWGFQRQQKDWYEQLDKVQKAPLQEALKASLPFSLDRGLLKEVDLAARREFCDWEMTPRLRQDGMGFLLPDMQGFRTIGKMLAVRTRVEMARGNFDQAVSTLQTGFALGRHVGQAPILVCNLVGLAIGHLMAEQVETLIQQPKAPNLYWALTDLPRPLIDMHRGLQGEKLWIYGLVPNYPEIETTPMSTQQVQKQISNLSEVLGMLGSRPAWEAKIPDNLALYFRALTVYPAARKYLLEHARNPKLLDAMPAIQVVLIYNLDQYDRLRDDLFKWARVPYWEALPGLKRAEEEVKKLRVRSGIGLDLAGAFLPSIGKVRFAQDRLERRLAALRCIEAIRLYGAFHGGKLPEKLSAIQEVPVPIDPVTGKEFEYRLEGNQAILSAPPPPGEKPEVNNTLVYKIQMVR